MREGKAACVPCALPRCAGNTAPTRASSARAILIIGLVSCATRADRVSGVVRNGSGARKAPPAWWVVLRCGGKPDIAGGLGSAAGEAFGPSEPSERVLQRPGSKGRHT